MRELTNDFCERRIQMNLFKRYLPIASEEQTDPLLQTEAVRIERIVSTGQVSPPGFW